MIPSDQQSGDQLLVNWQTVGSELASWAEAAAAAAAAGQGATPAAPHHGHNSVQDWESAILQLAAPQHHSVGPSSSYSSYGGFHDVVPPPMLNTIMQAEPILPIMSSSLRPHPQHQLGELLAGVNSGYGASTSTWGLLSSSGIRSSLSGLQEVGSSFQASLYSSYPNNRAAGAGLPASLCSGNSRVHYDQENGQKSSGLLQLGTQLAGSLDHRTRLEDIVKRELQNTSYTAPAYDVGATRLGLNLGLGRTYFSGEDYLGLGRLGKRLRFNSPAGYSCFSMQQQHVQAPLCQAEGCKADLGMAKHYHRRHKVCEYHSKAATVLISGQTQRFCQQCSRFHDLSEFDDGKRSCRKRLADHNRRRRKPQPAAAAPAADQGKPSDDKRESDQPQDVATSAGTNVKEYAPGTPPAEHKKKAQELITLENLTTTTAASTPESTTDHELKMMKEADLHNTNNKVQGGTNNWTKQDQRQGSMMSSSSSLSWLRSDLQSDGAAPCMKQSSAATLSDTEVDEHAERGPLAAQHGAEAFASMSKPLQAFLLQGRRGFHDAGDDDHDDDEDDGGAGCGAAAAACSPEDPRHGMHGGFFMSPSHVPLQVPNTAASLGLASPAATCSEMISHPSGSPPHDAATPSFGNKPLFPLQEYLSLSSRSCSSVFRPPHNNNIT